MSNYNIDDFNVSTKELIRILRGRLISGVILASFSLLFIGFGLHKVVKKEDGTTLVVSILAILSLLLWYNLVTSILDILLKQICYIEGTEVKLACSSGAKSGTKYKITYMDKYGEEKTKTFSHSDGEKKIKDMNFGKNNVRIYYTKMSRILIGYAEKEEICLFYLQK